MSIVLMAPAELPQTAIVLDNPIFTDEIYLQADVKRRYAEDGTPYSYVRSSEGKVHTLTLRMRIEKRFELEEFIRAYYQERWRYTDFNGDTINCYLQTELPEFRAIRDQIYEIRLDLEE